MDSMPAPPPASESSDSPSESIYAQPPAHMQQAPGQKRTASDAGLKASGLRPGKSVKRRASKACQCCRSRKVRCNVVEHGAPCTNCRLDEVECIVSESKRKKKWTNGAETSPQIHNAQPFKKPSGFPMAAAPPYEPIRRQSDHTPHTLYQDLDRDGNGNNSDSPPSLYTPSMASNLQRLGLKPGLMPETQSALHPSLSPMPPSCKLPAYIKPLPSRFGQDEISFLEKKGALTVPPTPLRDALLRSFAEFTYPYMPILNLHELVDIIDRKDRVRPVSLLLFQAIMFAGTASVDMKYLKSAGYGSRRDARRDFFQKTRFLYDFDYEVDRISLIQSLLLMTYWYETPDDQKDSHHWMGIAVSLCHTIGLHRNPTSLDPPRQKLWRRIWWSTYMRDRLIALGMRRPTRIKSEDFDVPMLTVDDFEIGPLPARKSCIPAECKIMRDTEMQRQLAIMCIAKAKLCIAMTHVLSVQYSVLHNNHGVVSEEGSTRTTMMLVANKLEPEFDEVQSCDQELQKWKDNLEVEAHYVVPTRHDIDAGGQSVALNRSLLHMIYHATVSALHRPHVLPSMAAPPRQPPSESLESSRQAVRLAATEITSIATRLYRLNLAPSLPTTGITVLLPAIIIHLLDIKANDESTRRASLKGFCECMMIMAQLRDIYAAADYSTAFLEAAIRKAEISLPGQKSSELKDSRNVIITSSQGLVDAGRRMHLVSSHAPTAHTTSTHSAALTPPPETAPNTHHTYPAPPEHPSAAADAPSPPPSGNPLSDADISQHLTNYLASTPPNSEENANYTHPAFAHEHSHSDDDMVLDPSLMGAMDFGGGEPDFESMINLDAAGDVWSLQEGAYAAMQGESSGFTMDVDWMKGMTEEGFLGGAMGLEEGRVEGEKVEV